jgi:hypothetical protein
VWPNGDNWMRSSDNNSTARLREPRFGNAGFRRSDEIPGGASGMFDKTGLKV